MRKRVEPRLPKGTPTRDLIYQSRAWSLGDQRWAKRCYPLAVWLLRQPKTWVEMEEWANSRGVRGYMLRHMLAWLEHQHLGYAVWTGGVLRWEVRDGVEWCDFRTRQEQARAQGYDGGVPPRGSPFRNGDRGPNFVDYSNQRREDPPLA